MRAPRNILAAIRRDVPLDAVGLLRWLMLDPKRRRKFRSRASMNALLARFATDGLQVTVHRGRRMLRLSEWARFRAEKWPET